MSRNKRDSLTDLKIVITGGEEIQQLIVLAALAKDLSPDPGTHVEWLTSTCNSAPTDLIPSSGSAFTCTQEACTHTYTQTIKYILKSVYNILWGLIL